MKFFIFCWVVVAGGFYPAFAQAQDNNQRDPTANIAEQRVAISSVGSAWFNFSNSDVESNRPGLEYDGDLDTTSLGLEWSYSRWSVGAAFSHTEGSFDRPGSSDERDERKTQFMPYITWKVHPGIHLRAFAGVNEGEFSRTRSIINSAATYSGSTDTDGTTLGLSAFVFAPVGPGLLTTAFTIVKDRTKFDGFVEQPSDPVSFTPINNPTFRQSVTTASFQGRYFVNWGKFTPFVSLGWFEHTSGDLNEVDSNGWTWGGGLAYRLTNKARLAMQYSQLEDKRFEENKTFLGQFIFTF